MRENAMAEIQLFAGCLAQTFFPQAGEAVQLVLGRLGLKVRRINDAFCCGQMAFNDGLRKEATTLARRLLGAVDPALPVVLPSGSCTAMIRVFYSDLLCGQPELAQMAQRIRPQVFEFSEYLTQVLKVTDVGARFESTVAYHPSCHLTRELRVTNGPLDLLKSVRGLSLREFEKSEECCGFGGLFSVKFPHISAAMLEDKIARVSASGAKTLVSCDLGCLMHIGGGLHRRRLGIETRHLAEVLAGR
jgi:L-lactate dehydrogenase complex protein LldE